MVPDTDDAEGRLREASVKDEALIALTGLGFERQSAVRMINDVFREGMGESELIAEALRSVGGNS